MSAPIDAPYWRMLTQDARDLGLNNSVAVANSATLVADWDIRSAKMREQHPAHLGIAYGARERNRIDFLKAGAGCPTLVFIHGGYWQMRAKETFTFCAAGPMAHGINVALLGYTLAPDATLDQIVSEIRAGIDHLVQALPKLGGDPQRMMVSGWSAGGHLSSMVLDHPSIKAGLLISGIYDLEPIRHSYLNAKLGLDETISRRNSPMFAQSGAMKPAAIFCGSAELPLLRAQSADYAAHRARYGMPVSYEEISQANHFSILDELASPSGRMTKTICQLLD